MHLSPSLSHRHTHLLAIIITIKAIQASSVASASPPLCLHTSSVHHPRHDTICSPRPPHPLRRMGSHRLGKKTATLHHSTIPPQATALRLDLHTIVLSTFDIVQCPLEMLPRILQPTRTIRSI